MPLPLAAVVWTGVRWAVKKGIKKAAKRAIQKAKKTPKPSSKATQKPLRSRGTSRATPAYKVKKKEIQKANKEMVEVVETVAEATGKTEEAVTSVKSVKTVTNKDGDIKFHIETYSVPESDIYGGAYHGSAVATEHSYNNVTSIIQENKMLDFQKEAINNIDKKIKTVTVSDLFGF